MEILNSSWLLRMLDSSAKKPADKLLSLFSCLETWLGAPGIREQFVSEFKAEHMLNQQCPALAARLTELASQARIAKPDVFVAQVLILLQGALTEEVRNPGLGALNAARIAAKAILEDAVKRPKLKSTWTYWSGGAVAGVLIAMGGYLVGSQIAVEASADYQAAYNRAMLETSPISPDLLAKVMALQAEIDSGHCPAPQLFAMPQDQAAAYMNTITYRASMHPLQDSERLTKFLVWYKQNREWECYFPPSNGHTAVSWVPTGKQYGY
ncbi:hypothetical protein [Methylovorus glucosotrophus]|uniref:Uncharacterized protein n=1 Tax=Methylovorus glucosotrophus (strain SIP3-4) TaxID=582744 RepID=C6X7Q7_METGS|nr:hypothetical protein [Methylovorus glucosotrophus]ACT51234.1 conserved hypothetical protein [Methylovorus glucosotrophus SIP3-4]KAF0843465.1 hypothetical protein FNL37_0893 [Methylovorus glucosotrophus]